MYIPDGMTEQQVLSAIDAAVVSVASYLKIPSYETDDIKQEGRLFALEALQRYDPNRGASLYTFLRTHIRNRLINLKIRKSSRQLLPCLFCDSYCGGGKCSEYCNIRECPNYVDAASAIDSSIIEHVCGVEEPDYAGNFDMKEIMSLIDKNLPIDMRKDYSMWLNGVKIPKRKEIKLIEVIRNIVTAYYISIDGDKDV